MSNVAIPPKLKDKVDLYYKLQAQIEQLKSVTEDLNDSIIKQMHRQRKKRAFNGENGVVRIRYSSSSVNIEKVEKLIKKKKMNRKDFFRNVEVFDESALESAIKDSTISVIEAKKLVDTKKGKHFLRKVKPDSRYN